MKTDFTVMVVSHTFLLLLLLLSFVGSIRAYQRQRRGASSGTVHRGKQNLNALYVIYGFSTVAMGLVVSVSESAHGHKSGLVLLDYAILTYLFFFNSWFRNSVVFRTLPRIEHD